NITNDFGPSNNASAEVYLMDLSNYKWVKQFGKTDNNELIIIICSIVLVL
ncbi:3366_t:CDS:1, partial [Gigaspora rosea]